MAGSRNLLLFSTILCILRKSDAFTPNPLIRSSEVVEQSARSRVSSGETALWAKKKKGGGKKKKNNNKQQSGFAWASSFTLKPFESSTLQELASLACASYQGRTGKVVCPDLEGAVDVPKALWNAPTTGCVIVGMDASGNGVVQYCNLVALETFGLKPDDWEKLLATQDPKSKEWKAPESPIVALDFPAEMKGDKKYESGYKKKIIRGVDGGEGEASRPDISLQNAHRWVLEKSALIDGKFVTEALGVAYAWDSWVEGEEALCRAGGIRESLVDAAELEERIKKQGDIIRELKEVEGYGNKDAPVVEAVQELLRMKAMLEEVSA